MPRLPTTLLALAALASAPLPARTQDEPEPIPDAPEEKEGRGPFERLILRRATLIDGTGAPPVGPVDIVIEKNRIVDVESVGHPGVPIDPGSARQRQRP